MKLNDFFAKLEAAAPNVAIDISADCSIKQNTAGTTFYIMVTTDGEEVAVHEASWGAFKQEVAEDGKLPLDWKISQSGMLYKRTKQTGKPWER